MVVLSAEFGAVAKIPLSGNDDFIVNVKSVLQDAALAASFLYKF